MKNKSLLIGVFAISFLTTACGGGEEAEVETSTTTETENTESANLAV